MRLLSCATTTYVPVPIFRDEIAHYAFPTRPAWRWYIYGVCVCVFLYRARNWTREISPDDCQLTRYTGAGRTRNKRINNIDSERWRAEWYWQLAALYTLRQTIRFGDIFTHTIGISVNPADDTTMIFVLLLLAQLCAPS